MNTIDFAVAAAFVDYGARIEKSAAEPVVIRQEEHGRTWFGPTPRHERARPPQ